MQCHAMVLCVRVSYQAWEDVLALPFQELKLHWDLWSEAFELCLFVFFLADCEAESLRVQTMDWGFFQHVSQDLVVVIRETSTLIVTSRNTCVAVMYMRMQPIPIRRLSTPFLVNRPLESIPQRSISFSLGCALSVLSGIDETDNSTGPDEATSR